MAFTPADQPSITATGGETAVATDDPPKAGASYIWLVTFANFGVFMALVTPIAISLAIRVQQLAPGNEEYLGYVTGAGGIAALLAAPLFGMLSDRTRSRLGRRRPYLIGLMVAGVIALVVLAEAPSILVLGLGWVLAQISWGSMITLLLASLADRLPEAQRGKVSALAGAFSQLAPVVGTLLAGGFAGDDFLLFLVPGAFGIVAAGLFVCLVHEPDSRRLPAAAPVTVSALARTYVFSPRQSPDFAWNWLGKLLFMSGLTFSSTFTAFFLAARMGVSVKEVAGLVAGIAGGSILAAVAGAIGGGFLSDKLRRRRMFVLVGACVFATGAVVMALSPSIPLIIVGAVLSNLGIGVFSAVDQALMLDVLPDRETDAGRYTGIYGFANTVAQGIAPLIAPIFLAIGATGGEKNYALLYFIAAAFTVAGGLVVLLRVKSVR